MWYASFLSYSIDILDLRRRIKKTKPKDIYTHENIMDVFLDSYTKKPIIDLDFNEHKYWLLFERIC